MAVVFRQALDHRQRNLVLYSHNNTSLRLPISRAYTKTYRAPCAMRRGVRSKPLNIFCAYYKMILRVCQFFI